MEWTPEAIKAEIDYRQAALREDAAQYRVTRRSRPVKKAWWRRLGAQTGPGSPADANDHREAA
ncbi:hypothetical protein ACFXGA_36755 [Actinosynnema sp. NPDC059335]|uniref:hypothetical protein n=1 Tax=Actinosynnema sp. NPDC059335 TaxID=3346804 RepID=UPI00366F8F57